MKRRILAVVLLAALGGHPAVVAAAPPGPPGGSRCAMCARRCCCAPRRPADRRECRLERPCGERTAADPVAGVGLGKPALAPEAERFAVIPSGQPLGPTGSARPLDPRPAPPDPPPRASL